MVKQFSISVILIAFLAMSFAMVSTWHITDDSAITFRIKSMLGTVDGTLGGIRGTIAFDPNDVEHSRMDITLDLSTISTGMHKRDKDIKEEKVWFDIAQYPLIAFRSERIARSAAGYTVDGTLTIKGISKKTQIPFTFSDAGGNNSFIGSLKINRLDFNVGKSSAAVKDDVEISINVPVKK